VRDEVSMIVAVKFFESSNSNRVFFIENVDNISNKIKNVFVTDYKNNRITVAMAESGFINNQLDGSKQIKIQYGNRYEGQPSQGDFKILEFDEYIVEIDKKPSPLIKPSAKETPTIDLINYPIPLAQGELLWRIGLPLMAFGLIMLAVPLAYVNPRKGSYIAMLYAVFFYLIYSNLLNITQSLVSESKRSFLTTFWPIHVLAMILALLLLMYRMNPSIPWWQRFIPGGSRGS
jgi:lipopolysaccharide export system permease protein